MRTINELLHSDKNESLDHVRQQLEIVKQNQIEHKAFTKPLQAKLSVINKTFDIQYCLSEV